MKKRRKAKLGELAHHWLVPAAGMLFLIVGGAKLISVFGDAKILKLPDPVLRLPWWLLMSTAGIVEVVVGSLCVLGKDRLSRAQALLLLSGGLILYRAMDWHSEAKEPCPCLGGLLDVIGVSHGAGDIISLSILGFATIAGLAGWFTIGKEKGGR